MIDAPSSATRIVRFGPFELDLRSGELRKNGSRVGLQDQPLQILSVLLERPGEMVTREELRQRLWPGDTFVDFEHGLNAAVKRLRDALGDSADTPRFIETVPRRGYRFMGSVDGGGAPPRTPPRTLGRRYWAAAVAFAALVGFAVAIAIATRSSYRSLAAPTRRGLTRITSDPGAQIQPTWSPDGRFIAYASNRSGNFDIWVQPVAGGDAVQVTKDPADDWQPDWSPNGNQIVFRSERQGGGLFLASVLGGEEKRLTSFGYRPRWAPDGSRILLAGGMSPHWYVVRPDGGPPRQVLDGAYPGGPRGVLAQASHQQGVTWHPDGRRLSVWETLHTERLRFWTVPADGGVPVRSELASKVQEAMAKASLSPDDLDNFAWDPDGRTLFFTALSRQVRNIWRVGVDPGTLRWVDGPERVTTGPGADTDLALSRDGKRVAFVTSTSDAARIWRFPFDPVAGRITGQGQPVTPPEWYSSVGDITRDGRKLLLWTVRPGRLRRDLIIEKSLPDGHERQLAVDETEIGEARGGGPAPIHLLGRWSPDGTRIVYAYRPAGTASSFTIRTLDAATGQEQQITSPDEGQRLAREFPYHWSGDGQWIIASGERYVPGQSAIALLPLSAAPAAERQARVVTSDSWNSLWGATLSPDDRWIAFNAAPRADSSLSTVYVVRRSGGEWIQVTQGIDWDDKPRWSPDGRTIYFVSSQGGELNVWGIRFEPTQGRLLGEAFPVTVYKGTTRILGDIIDLEIGIARDSLVLPIVDSVGGIWMLEDIDR